MDLTQLNDFEAMWLTLYGESRGEPIEGQIGVANVILNKNKESGKSIRDICLAPEQFSCWLPHDPNFPILDKLADNDFHGGTIDTPIIKQLKAITEMVTTGRFMDNTNGSNHYLTIADYRSPQCPLWAKRGQFKLYLGRQAFLWAA